MTGLKRLCCCLVVALLSACGANSPEAMTDNGWSQYRTLFVTEEGAVRDTGNNNISHSEGQGYALLMAEAYADETHFRKIWQWTRAHLQIRDDYLFAWSWNPQEGVKDRNNATDGDLLIAWALYRAGQRWNNEEYTAHARNIVADIRRLLVQQVGDIPVLVPGVDGFVKDGVWQLNLAYWVYPALAAISAATADPVWQELIQSGKRLTSESQQGDWRLPPDWIDVRVGQKPVPSADRPPRFGYEAVRVPLYLVWSGDDKADVIAASVRFWATTSRSGFAPAWIDLVNGSKAEYAAPAGFLAVWKLAGKARGKPVAQVAISTDLKSQDYYSASLTMLSRMALKERFK